MLEQYSVNHPSATLLVGCLSYVAFFKRGERQLYPERYILAFTGAFLLLVSTRIASTDAPPLAAFKFASTYISLFLCGLLGSLLLFRIFLNPLNRFPGPFWARISSLHLSFKVGRKFNAHTYLQQLHEKYGRVVRIGPNDLSITDADAVQIVSSARSKCTKAIWYAQSDPITSLHVTRSPAEHTQRRRIWSQAFSDAALRGYETRVQKYNDLLIQALKDSNGAPKNMTEWFNFYSFDVMGDLGFAESFGMLESGDTHWAIQTLQSGLNAFGYYYPTWLVRTLRLLTTGKSAATNFKKFFVDQLEKRMKKQGSLDVLDISHYLIEHFQKSDPAAKQGLMPMLQGDSRLIIVAGSDTTAVTLTHLFYYLTTIPGLQEQVREEVRKLAKEDGTVSNTDLQTAELLNSCINETLRLHPPVPSGAPRKTPRDGVYLRETFIPADTVITMPWFAMGRDPDYFPNPNQFIPQRFTCNPELITHKDAWGPFNVGPYNCIGKNLALMEIRTLTTRILLGFDVSLAPGETGKNLIMGAKDHFTLGIAPFHLVFNSLN